MKKLLGKLMLGITGWKLVVHDESFKQEKKVILICVPHTTNWDFYYSLACFWVLGMPFKIFIKDYYTKSWFGFFFKAIGCIGVDRNKSQNLVEYAVQIIEEADEIALINTPEGTRSFSPKWKQGFYHIARQTNIPIALCYADYKKKQCGILKLVRVEDKSFEALLDEIAPYYNPAMAKYPENYNPKLY
ncbi:1-acyl-sn-glycerol-3-phosphate acyltransferase [Myroides gitamensis]|uniref:1-acylglycerol-3-phosphate O-acyltransferases n=1 Tax=Myroides odoratus TaxID=256 RepID=A0A378U1B0_MYROD|nr:1-acyl-sn-glycerol-3-phosphate acyltransferase [Myroides odoratus]MCS4239898.1 1-acyl-sn-glycerol-3-phosphate acyltransferase [Myroides odoratus]MDH6602606.1 1-acyl-sn-glycerol-3-phosphate acyltransferase [Myroides gitamensis]QQU03723.1 1-acyl-sn-glycerol-3-phosphate acyltransferase [Myroides odoratus]STZ68998.1 1-acylglycerol-3-phosphate O-acyltransferases [Myroides odoratus]